MILVNDPGSRCFLLATQSRRRADDRSPIGLMSGQNLGGREWMGAYEPELTILTLDLVQDLVQYSFAMEVTFTKQKPTFPSCCSA